MSQVVTELVIDSDTSGADRFSQAMDKAGSSAKDGSNSVSSMSLAIAGVGVATIGALASLRAFVDYVGNQTQALVDMADHAALAGISVKEFQQTLFAARASGLTEKDFVSGLDRIGADLTAASRGVTEFGKLFEANGLSIKNANGELKNSKQAVADLAGLVQNASPQIQQAIARIAGVSAAWVPFLKQGAEGIEAQKKAAADLGVVIDDNMIEKAKEFNTQWKTAVATWDLQFKASLASVMPLLIQAANLASTIIEGVGSASSALARNSTPDEEKTKSQLSDQIAQVMLLREQMLSLNEQSGEFKKYRISQFGELLGLPSNADITQANALIDKLSALYDKKPTAITVNAPGSTALPATGSDRDALQTEIDRLEKHVAVTKADTEAVGQSAAAQAGLRAEATLYAAAERAGKTDLEQYAEQFMKVREEIEKTTAELNKAKLASDIKFNLDTAFLSDADRQVASILRQTYGDEWKNMMDGPIAGAIKWNAQLKSVNDTIRSSATSFATDLVGNLRQGQSAMDAIGHAAQNLSTTLTNSTISNLLSGNFVGAAVSGIGAIISGIMGDNQKKVDDAKAAADRITQYSQRAQAAGLDTNTQAGALAAQELQFQTERLQEAKNGGKAMTALLNAENAEKLALQQQWDQKDIDAQKARVQSDQDRLFNAMNDNTTLQGQLAAADRQFLKERLDEMQAGGQAINDLVAAQEQERINIVKSFNDELLKFVQGVAKTVRDYLQSLKTGASSILNPHDQLAAAQSNFSSQLALANSGDRNALSGITQVAQTLLDQAKSFYASSQGYTDIYNQVTSALNGVANISGGTVSDADNIVAAINDSKTVTSGTITTTSLQEQSLLGAINTLADRFVNAIDGLGAVTTNIGNSELVLLGKIANQTAPQHHWYDFAGGGMVGNYATGGMVGNGIYGVDSVVARYAGGGTIGLAGGEYIMPADQTRMFRSQLDAMRSGRSTGSNDNNEGNREVARWNREDTNAIISKLDEVLDAINETPGKNATATRKLVAGLKQRAA